MGWLASLSLLGGALLVAEKRRSGFLWLLAGNALWCYVAVTRGLQLDLLVVSLVFGGVDFYGWWRWGAYV